MKYIHPLRVVDNHLTSCEIQQIYSEGLLHQVTLKYVAPFDSPVKIVAYICINMSNKHFDLQEEG
jgi:hypothetical protein